MHLRSFLVLAALMPLLCFAGASAPRADDDYRVSGPHTHENLTVYFIHGASRPGPVPLTLAEALTAKSVRVLETGQVNELSIENLGGQEVIVQSGDIVKGGKQDRVLSVSLVLPPHSGVVPITAFCVEHGRWSKRGYEDAQAFNSAAASLPSRAARHAIQPAGAGLSASGYAPALAARQQDVWNNVAGVQHSLSNALNESVAAPQSPSSLQLALENHKLKEVQEGYTAALQPAGESGSDIIGYAFAINGKIDSAEVYPSNALFRKMWQKLLTANVTEAIATNSDAATAAPASADVAAFLKAAGTGAATKQTLTRSVELEIRTNDKAAYLETRRADGSWAHRSYIAK
jgi:ARG/rhodanese/phosphatase superfamily protein